MFSIGGKFMKRSFIVFAVVLFLVGPALAFAGESVKLNYVSTLYEDANGVGLKHPESVACGADSFWVADTGNSRLLRLTMQEKRLTADAVFPLTSNSAPIVVQINSKGNIYVLDGRERRIIKLSAVGEHKGFLALPDLPGAKESVLRSFKIDTKDNIYLLDVFAERVVILNPAGKYIKQIPFPKGYGFFSDLAVDDQCTIYLVEGVKAVVYSALVGSDAFSPLTQSMKDVMNFPVSIALDSRGIVYLIDQYGSGLVLIGRDGSFLGRKLGVGWTETLLYYPSQLCVSQAGHLFIADRSNSRVQLFIVVEN
jgi:streptogramin lyase